jgi:hypothetical protein
MGTQGSRGGGWADIAIRDHPPERDPARPRPDYRAVVGARASDRPGNRTSRALTLLRDRRVELPLLAGGEILPRDAA